MSTMFPSAPSASSMSFGPEGSLLLSAPPQSLGTPTGHHTSTREYSDQTPSHPSYAKEDSHAPSLSHHAFTPQHAGLIPQHSSDVPPVAMVSSEVNFNQPVEDSHPYNPVQKPVARSNRGPPKQLTPAESPEGKSGSNGRKRARTKVVAWDPRDLDDIYVRKEVHREDWDSICRVRLFAPPAGVKDECLTLQRIIQVGLGLLCVSKSSYVHLNDASL